MDRGGDAFKSSKNNSLQWYFLVDWPEDIALVAYLERVS